MSEVRKPRTRAEAYQAIVEEIQDHREGPSSSSCERVLMAAMGYTMLQEDGYAVRAALITVASFLRSIKPAVSANPQPFEDHQMPTT